MELCKGRPSYCSEKMSEAIEKFQQILDSVNICKTEVKHVLGTSGDHYLVKLVSGEYVFMCNGYKHITHSLYTLEEKLTGHWVGYPNDLNIYVSK